MWFIFPAAYNVYKGADWILVVGAEWSWASTNPVGSKVNIECETVEVINKLKHGPHSLEANEKKQAN